MKMEQKLGKKGPEVRASGHFFFLPALLVHRCQRSCVLLQQCSYFLYDEDLMDCQLFDSEERECDLVLGPRSGTGKLVVVVVVVVVFAAKVVIVTVFVGVGVVIVTVLIVLCCLCYHCTVLVVVLVAFCFNIVSHSF